MSAPKVINDPGVVVTETLEGLVASNPSLKRLDGFPDIKVVFRDQDPAQVAVITGGGSGHEPAFAGYVGDGMLSAAVCGEVYASPTTDAVLAALRAVTGPAGALLIIMNYTGDRLNFGLAAEIARGEGLNVELVVVGEDAALSGNGIAGRRGLAGTLLVQKVAGAAAAAGADLATCAAVAREASTKVATMGAALTVCTLPGATPSDRLAPGEMEMGLGIHGEPGAYKCDVKPADEIVRALLDRILYPITGYFPFTARERIALMVNGLGATPLMELNVCARAALSDLSGRGLTVERCYVGNFMTALDMAGFSITLMKVDDTTLDRLDADTAAAAWPRAGKSAPVEGGHVAPVPTVPVDSGADLKGPSWGEDGAGAAAAAVEAAAGALEAASEQLNAWDAVCGDGDCGSTMRNGASIIRGVIKDASAERLAHPAALFAALGEACRGSMGGSSGALYAILFTDAANAFAKAPAYDVHAASGALQAAVHAVADIGGASVGHRTMLDALMPAADAFAKAAADGRDLKAALDAAVAAAKAGAEATAAMQSAEAGRASYVGADLTGTPDPGASAVATWMAACSGAV